MSDSRTVTVSRVFDAPIDLVYRAWTEPEHIANWMKCDPEATMDVAAWEPRVGGAIAYHMFKPGVFEARTTGRVVEADPPRAFAFTTDPNPELGAPELTIRIALAEVDGRTELTLTHSGLPTDEFCGIVEGGWSVSLELLRDVVVALVGAYASARMSSSPERRGEGS